MDKTTKLSDVKSDYIIKKIFSFQDERRKLDIIKYSNFFKKKISVNIKNYKMLSGRYKIMEINGIGKEYSIYNDKLIFEGEYKNGKRYKGKEYDIYNDKLIFEGEYLNGKRWNGSGIKDGKGYVKEYNKDNILIYEGQIENGEKNGKGKEYYDKNILKFEGEYLNGKRWNGNGYDIQNNIIYQIKNGKGYAKEYYYNDFILLENIENLSDEINNINGKLKFEGEYFNGEKNGKGKEYNLSVISYVYFNKNKDSKYTNKKYEILQEHYLMFEGEYKYGKRNGNGKEYDNKGILKFEGEYINGKRNGNGKEYYNKNKLFYEGEYLNDKKNGKGKEYSYNGKVCYEGDYLNDKRNGNGKEYNYGGQLVFEGEFENGKRKLKF